MSERTAMVMLAMEVGPLVRDLSEWEPVGTLRETVLGTVLGTDGMEDRDVSRLRSWNRRWSLIRPEVREFYRTHVHENESASVALFHILEFRTHEVRQITQSGVHHLWTEHHGDRPPWSLFPRIP